jgi:dTDP-4-dehydrorhamnose 3,5-epimerase
MNTTMHKPEPKRDKQTVTPEGLSTGSLIAGVIIRYAIAQPDERGELCEIYNPAWGVTDAPLVYVYQSTIRPGKVKGWVIHYEQDDRLFFSSGAVRMGLYDAREASPTYKKLSVFTITERNRALVVIPRGVFHGIQNVGSTEAVFVNMPSRPFDHANPDKYRLPLSNDLIPFAFEDTPGW